MPGNLRIAEKMACVCGRRAGISPVRAPKSDSSALRCHWVAPITFHWPSCACSNGWRLAGFDCVVLRPFRPPVADLCFIQARIFRAVSCEGDFAFERKDRLAELQITKPLGRYKLGNTAAGEGYDSSFIGSLISFLSHSSGSPRKGRREVFADPGQCWLCPIRAPDGCDAFLSPPSLGIGSAISICTNVQKSGKWVPIGKWARLKSVSCEGTGRLISFGLTVA